MSELKGRLARVLPSHPWIYPAMPWERVHANFLELSGRQYHHRADYECDETDLQLSWLTQEVGDG